MRFAFDDFEIDTSALELRQAGAVQPVEPQVFEVLRVLIENRHRVMSRDELVDDVWHGRIVSDSAVAFSIKAARQAIGDDGKTQRLIRTLNRRGFRFVGEVRAHDTQPVVMEAADSVEEDHRPGDFSEHDGRPSIAVLPFRMQVGFDRFPALSEAIAHDISRGLSRLRWLRVIATASAFKFRDSTNSISEVAGTLGCRYCLTGSVEICGETLILAVELIDSRGSRIVWADSFEGSINDVDALRAEVTGKTIAMAELQIPPSEARDSRLRSPNDLDAWAAFYLGLVNVYRFNADATRQSIALFERAIQLEPSLARAHAALSFAHFQHAFNKYPGMDVASATKAAALHADRGLDLDEYDPFCNFVRGRVSWLTGEVEESFQWLDRATQINPNFAQGFYSRALASVLTNTSYDVHGAAERAMGLSPLDPLMYGFQGIRAFEFLSVKDYDSAKLWADKAAGAPGALLVMDLVAVVANALAGDESAAERWAIRARHRRPEVNQELFFHALPFRDGALRSTISNTLKSRGF